MTCAQMGAVLDCEAMINGATAEEMATNGMAHVTENHPDLALEIGNMSSEEQEQWMQGFRIKFDALPEL